VSIVIQSVVEREITSGLALLSDEEIEATAADAWSGLSDVGDVEDLTRKRGVEVEPERDLPDGFDGLTLPTKLLVRPSRIRALWVLRVLHELAHHYLAKRFHTHADVWALTLAMGAPLRVLRGLRGYGAARVAELKQRTGLPAWACVARLEMGAVTYTLPRAI
jgi:hypothetical protein